MDFWTIICFFTHLVILDIDSWDNTYININSKMWIQFRNCCIYFLLMESQDFFFLIYFSSLSRLCNTKNFFLYIFICIIKNNLKLLIMKKKLKWSKHIRRYKNIYNYCLTNKVLKWFNIFFRFGNELFIWLSYTLIIRISNRCHNCKVKKQKHKITMSGQIVYIVNIPYSAL